jgi:hypothetical protein
MMNFLRTLRRSHARRRRRTAIPVLEALEGRAVPAQMAPLFQALAPPAGGGAVPVPGYTPSQIRHAYGFDQVAFPGAAAAADGSGETIAIVTACDSPTLAADLAAFDTRFQIPDATLAKVGQDGSNNLPPSDPAWAQETALDTEWAHALAPRANLLVVEASSGNDGDLYAATDYAAAQPGVHVVSMSFGGPEDPSETAADGHFRTPAGHDGVTFVAAAGDTGAVTYPAASPNVVGVGGTTLALDGNSNRSSETAWANGGGGLSQYEATPAYQANLQPAHLASRGTPDVAYDANPNTGFAVYDSFGNPDRPWLSMGGTSAGAPQWAALIALADQGRRLAGRGSLDGPSQTLPILYGMQGSAFYDVTAGGNGHFQAGPGYDLVTGLGTPFANQVVAGLIGRPGTAGPTGSGQQPPPSPPPGVSAGPHVSIVIGSPLTGVLATITDPSVSAGDLAATIDWGNGQSSVGNVVPLGDGAFVIEGVPTYTRPSSYTVAVTVTADNDGGQAETIDTVVTVEPPSPLPAADDPPPDDPAPTAAAPAYAVPDATVNPLLRTRASVRHAHAHHPARHATPHIHRRVAGHR